jgi:phage-related protein
MRLSWPIVVSTVLTVCLFASLAQARPGPKNAKTPIDEFMRMSPAEQQKALNRLPPEQRRKLEERLERFNQLPRGQQQTLRNMYDRLNQLPPERQQAVRKSLNQFSQQPPERRQAMRQELRSMAGLEAQDREARMASVEFREKFSEKEQRIVRDMSGLLPAR